ncbi:hypothetical protein QBZ16_003455 [Prototheca wickerhamii]|uniref:Uncharacterized protein n=1 Tax=Prototheca wickerhamii TaxID=3111 RepID=A0AAD9MKS8_PROWI|nr:hypothetical protein QBZ16_003455 [Prototheca wickerhamii]
MEALDSLIEANKITPELAHRVAQEVWDFVIKNVTFRLSPTQSSSKKDDLEVSADRVRLVLVDSKVVTAANPQQG